MLHGLLTHDPLAIEQHYQTIRTIQQPTLILWGRDDKVDFVFGIHLCVERQTLEYS